ncbi:MAG: hypothetical protein IJV40_01525 [Oscillospiraceae bacterium]|nr:hypothetical protein [Oscillospiraceae bacterium]
MKRSPLPRASRLFALLLSIVLMVCLLTGCTVPLTGRNLLAASLGPTAVSIFTNSAQVQTDTAGASLPCYYDTATGIYYYVCEDLNKVSPTEYAYTLRVFYFQNGVARTRTLATRTVLYNSAGQAFTSCRDYAGNSITDTDYANYADRTFANYTKVTLSLDSGSITAVPSTPAAPTPTPIPTPAPTPVPTPGNYSGPAPVITKNPTSESLSTGGTTWFIAHAQNASRLTWQAVSPEGLVYTMSEALSIHPGLILENQANDTLAVRNVPLSLNGWGFQARFEGTGGVAVSSAAYIYVGDFVASYQSVLAAYRAAYQAGGHTAQYAASNGLSPMISHSAHVGYAFKDLNKDGTPELFIGGLNTDDTARTMVYDVYTLIDGTPTRLAVSSEQDRFYLCTDSALLNQGSRGSGLTHCFVYRFANNRLSPVEGYMSCFTGSAKDGYYYQQGAYSPEPRDGDVPLSANTFNARVHERENTVFVLILTQIA